MKFYTIGVYGLTEKEFFQKLLINKIEIFCDIRQRRGVRGSKYAFVNSKRLQKQLNTFGIEYIYIKDLAPTKEIRALQKSIDQKKNVLKKNRDRLSKEFTNSYKDKVSSVFNFEGFLRIFSEANATNIVLFCVEERYAACHRSIVSDKLEKLGYKVGHL